MVRRMSKTWISGLLAVLALAAGATVSAESDSGEYIYPGNMCVPLGGDSQQDWDDVYYTFGRAQNLRGYALDLYCPSIRNRVNGSYDGGSWIYVYDGNPTGGYNVDCQLIARQSNNPTGSYIHDDEVTSFYSSGYYKLTFGDMGGYTYGYHYIHCSLPPAYGSSYSMVTGYYVVEE